ncbi:MAG: glycosyl hydrolase family 28-related protein, partial [Dehalococcoidales bacterium]|nr:glycosyl hydrolase family 28-related protein [Dehalococcoidales bacterium]
MTDYLISKGPIGEEDQNKWDGVNTTFTRDTSTGGSITLNSVGTAVDALIVYGGGVNYTAATINLAISSIGSSKVRLLLRQGSWVLEDDVTVPANITLEIADGALIPTTGYTLTIAGGLVAPPQKVFSGTGTVTVAKGTVVNPLWWGAIGDGSTDCTAALQYAVNAVSDDGGIVLIPASDTYYKVTDAITVSHPVTIVGESRYYSQIHQATAAKTIFTVTASYVTIKDLHLTGPGGISLSSGSTAISVTGYS